MAVKSLLLMLIVSVLVVTTLAAPSRGAVDHVAPDQITGVVSFMVDAPERLIELTPVCPIGQHFYRGRCRQSRSGEYIMF